MKCQEAQEGNYRESFISLSMYVGFCWISRANVCEERKINSWLLAPVRNECDKTNRIKSFGESSNPEDLLVSIHLGSPCQKVLPFLKRHRRAFEFRSEQKRAPILVQKKSKSNSVQFIDSFNLRHKFQHISYLIRPANWKPHSSSKIFTRVRVVPLLVLRSVEYFVSPRLTFSSYSLS